MDDEKEPILSPTVKALGAVSLFADMSSEMVYPLNPVFITQILGAPPWALGLIEGVAESTASLLKLFAGWFSDRMNKRKPFAVLGYGFGALGKPLIAVSTGWWGVLFARFIDRTGKGLRTAPRDALIAENCPEKNRGQAFGFHRSMDTIGAVLGPLIGFLILTWFGKGHPASLFRPLYWIAFLPGVIAVIILATMIQDKGTVKIQKKKREALPSLRDLSPVYKLYLLLVALFSLGNSSDTFLILRATNGMHIPTSHVLLLYAMFNVVEAALSYPAGRLSDRIGRKPLIIAGFAIFGLVYIGFAFATFALAAWLLFILYGFYYTLTGGVQRALAADLSHPDRRATEIGAYHMVIGISALPASIFAGWLYGLHPAAPFVLGAICAFLAAFGMLFLRIQKPVSVTA
jgi:MFS family permease